jgi:hypothetical protein
MVCDRGVLTINGVVVLAQIHDLLDIGSLYIELLLEFLAIRVDDNGGGFVTRHNRLLRGRIFVCLRLAWLRGTCGCTTTRRYGAYCVEGWGN